MAKARILAVDDQRYFRNLLEGMLTEAGFGVETASSAEEALSILDRSRFDVIITDLVMPEMGGDELAERLLEQRPKTRILYMTGYAQSSRQFRSATNGPVLQKPFTADDLLEHVRRLLDRSMPATQD